MTVVTLVPQAAAAEAGDLGPPFRLLLSDDRGETMWWKDDSTPLDGMDKENMVWCVQMLCVLCVCESIRHIAHRVGHAKLQPRIVPKHAAHNVAMAHFIF
eukprot:380636-Pelagomonas_calceolata.AAC.11